MPEAREVRGRDRWRGNAVSRSAIAAAVAGLAVLAGCGSTSEPSAPPTSEDALTTATSEPDVVEETTEVAPTTEAPEETEETEEPISDAMDQSEEGAEAFVEHYMELLNAAYTTGDIDQVRQLSTAECQSCEELTSDAKTSPAGEPLFETAVNTSVVTGDTARVEAEIKEGDDATQAVFQLAWGDDEWKVDAILIGQR